MSRVVELLEPAHADASLARKGSSAGFTVVTEDGFYLPWQNLSALTLVALADAAWVDPCARLCLDTKGTLHLQMRELYDSQPH